jgi:hypothetical protein
MMNVSPQEAQESLQAVRKAASQMRHSVAAGASPYYLILWGATWMVGYSLNYLIPSWHAGIVWLGLVTIAGAITWLLSYRFRSKIRLSGGERIWQFWLFLWLYATLWWWIAWPTEPNQGSLLIVTVVMFGYVILGLWTDRTLTWVGLIVTALSMAGYYLLPDYFSLWMAFLGGGTLIGSGLYIRRAWK